MCIFPYGTVRQWLLDWLWDLSIHLASGHHGLFFRVQSYRGVKLNTRFHLPPNLRMRGVRPPTRSLYGVYLI